MDDLYEKLGDHLMWHTLQETGRALRHKGVHCTLATDERLAPELVSQYMRVKARQML